MGTGKRAAPKKRATFRPSLLLLALGVTLSVVAWGYLVKSAIDFGVAGRGGDSTAWWFLGLASLGAVACLFVGLMLMARLLRALGIISPPAPAPPPAADPAPRPTGGHRAAR